MAGKGAGACPVGTTSTVELIARSAIHLFSHSIPQVLRATPRARRFYDSYLWVVDPRQVTFFFFAKRKSPKKRRPRVAAPLEKSTQAVPCAPHQPRARAELAGAH